MKFLLVVILSLVSGAAMAWVLHAVSNQEAIRKARKRMSAHLMELRLFGDEPVLVWRAQKDLLAANGRYIAEMLRPAAVLALPFILLLIHLNPFFGIAPLRVGDVALVTARLSGSGTASLEVPSGVSVEAPPVRVVGTQEVVWRVRTTEPVNGTMRVRSGSETAFKRLVAGEEPFYLASERPGSWWSWLWVGGEFPSVAGTVRSVAVSYPEARMGIFGLEAHWAVWFVVLSMVAAFVVAKLRGVAL